MRTRQTSTPVDEFAHLRPARARGRRVTLILSLVGIRDRLLYRVSA
jgi:hypothetical protein